MRSELPGIIIGLMTSLFFSCAHEKKYDPQAYLSPAESEEVTWKIIRYLGKPPENEDSLDIFSTRFDEHYREQASLNRIDQYYIDETTQTHYFLISRLAPSITEKRVATGGKMKFDDEKKLIEYEEVFRTWKLVPDTLTRRASLLFDKMVKGESLEPYLIKNSNDVEYIEFPDDLVTYDTEKRKWITNGFKLGL